MSNKITQIEKSSEIYIHRENENVSDFSIQREILASVTADNICIPCKNKIKKTPDSLVIIKEPIRDTVNPRKISQEDTVTDAENVFNIKHLHIF